MSPLEAWSSRAGPASARAEVTLEALPSAPEATEPELPLAASPRVVTLWRLQRLLRLCLFWAPVSAGLAMAVATVAPLTAGVVLAVTLMALQLLLALAWPALEYEALRYAVREHDLLVRSGVLFRHWTAIPHQRIQHVDTRQGPLERLFGLSRLLVFTAAGMSGDGSIPGLEAKEAERLRDTLSRRGGDDGV